MVKIRTRPLRRATSGDGDGAGDVEGEPIAATGGPGPETDPTDDGESRGAAAGPETGGGDAPEDEALEGPEPFVLTVEDRTRRRRTTTKKTKGRRSHHRARPVGAADDEPAERPPSATQSRQDAALAVEFVQQVIRANFGPEAAWTDEERDLIVPAATRILTRMTPGGVKMFAAISDPIMLMTGLFMWWTRVSKLRGMARAGQTTPTPIRSNMTPGGGPRPPRTASPSPGVVPEAPVMPPPPPDEGAMVDDDLANAWGG